MNLPSPLATPAERYQWIEQELLEYCKLDTLAMVRMWEMLRGAPDSGR